MEGNIMNIKNLVLLVLFAGLIFLLAMAACEQEKSDDDDDAVDPGIGQSPYLSDCKGVDNKSGDDDDLMQCGDETLEWSFDNANRTGTFIHKNLFLNCCGQHSMAAYYDQEDQVYEISETDAPEMIDGEGARCGCMCLFDFGIEIDDLDPESINVKITMDVTDDDDPRTVRWEGQIDLSQGNGEITIEENVGWCD